jgi:hypothetical protein
MKLSFTFLLLCFFSNAGLDCLMAMRKSKIVAEVRKRFFVFIASTWHDG